MDMTADEKLASLRAELFQLADELDAEGSGTDGGLTDGLWEGAQRIRDTLNGTAHMEIKPPLCPTCGKWETRVGYGTMEKGDDIIRCCGCWKPVAECPCTSPATLEYGWREQSGPSPAVGDGVTDDTAAVQAGARPAAGLRIPGWLPRDAGNAPTRP